VFEFQEWRARTLAEKSDLNQLREMIDDQKSDRLTYFDTVEGRFDSISKKNTITSVPCSVSDSDTFSEHMSSRQPDRVSWSG
jgi:hypothetical protein